MAERDGLLVDFGGVLTTDVFASFRAFCEAEGLEPDLVTKAFAEQRAPRELLKELECGRLSEEAFNAALGEELGIDGEDLAARLFAAMRPDEAMVGAVAAARRAGVRTGLVSNSWGADMYDRSRFAELFDAVVISGEEGLRKPDPRIYAIALERLGLPAERVVFVDDLGFNLKPAQELGMATVRHRSAEQTIPELEQLLGVALGGASRAA